MRFAILSLARNEIAFIRNWVREAKAFTGDVWVGDTGSSDGTAEAARDEGAQVVDIPYRLLLEHGFGEARTVLARQLPTSIEWVHWLDVDERASPNLSPVIQETKVTRPLAIRTLTPTKIPGFSIDNWREMAKSGEAGLEWHIRSHPRRGDIRWRGYIHEELFVGECKAALCAVVTPIGHLHFTHQNPRIDYPKDLLYGFLLDRALRVPELQKYTSQYWFRQYAPSVPYKDQAAAFRELCPEARDL